MQKKATDIVFNIIDPDMRVKMHARSLTDEMLSSLEIEGEKISYDRVYSSICKRLDINMETQAKSDQFAESIATLALDITEDLEELSIERIIGWHSLLFSSMAGIKPKNIGSYRKGPVYISKGNGRNTEIIYEGLPAERTESEMERLIGFINGENEEKPLVKSAIVALWFLCIHPFEDGNGRISRAISDYVLSKSMRKVSSSHASRRTWIPPSIILTSCRCCSSLPTAPSRASYLLTNGRR